MMNGWLARAALSIAAMAAFPGHAAWAQATPTAQRSNLAKAFDGAAANAELQAAMTRERIPGFQAVVIAKDGEIWRAADGLADIERKRPMTADTRIQIGSVTKTFTASLVADLVAAGKLRWSDTLGRIFPDIQMQPDIAAISLADLASHTSRLSKDPPNRVDVDGTWRPYTQAELHAALRDPSLKLVDQDWNYSNFGFAILGHVVERAAGKPYEQVLRERILGPLAMTSTSVAIPPDQEILLAVHYWPEDKPVKPRPRWRFGDIAGFGGLTSTADDLAKFLAYQLNPRAYPNILDPRATISMRAARFMFPDWSVGFGRPWIERREKDGTLIIEHGGEVDGHSAMIMFAPALGVGVVVTANLGQDGAEAIAKPLFARALAAAHAQPKPKL